MEAGPREVLHMGVMGPGEGTGVPRGVSSRPGERSVRLVGVILMVLISGEAAGAMGPGETTLTRVTEGLLVIKSEEER